MERITGSPVIFFFTNRPESAILYYDRYTTIVVATTDNTTTGEKQHPGKEGRQLITISSDVIRRAAAGDERAFADLVNAYQTLVYNTALSIVRDREGALDVSQEVFIRLYNAAGGFRCESTLKTWLFRMCKNCAYDYMRKFYKHKTVSLSKSDDDEDSRSIEDIPSEQTTEGTALTNEKIRAVHRAINMLPEEQRDVIILRELEGMSYADISKVLGIEEGTVKSRISRGREALKKFLEKYK